MAATFKSYITEGARKEAGVLHSLVHLGYEWGECNDQPSAQMLSAALFQWAQAATIVAGDAYDQAVWNSARKMMERPTFSAMHDLVETVVSATTGLREEEWNEAFSKIAAMLVEAIDNVIKSNVEGVDHQIREPGSAPIYETTAH
jgi:hypothetical protein